MSGPKFTPGPWSADTWPDGKGLAFVIKEKGNEAEDDDILCALSNHADARLIAAAPELYEACAEILDGLDAITPMGKWRLIDEWSAKARAALAKARGEP